MVESDIERRMEPLENLIISTIEYIHNVVEPNVFVAICRGFLGQDGAGKIIVGAIILQ